MYMSIYAWIFALHPGYVRNSLTSSCSVDADGTRGRNSLLMFTSTSDVHATPSGSRTDSGWESSTHSSWKPLSRTMHISSVSRESGLLSPFLARSF